LEQIALGCFFEAELNSFAGCVNKRQQTSTGVNERRQALLKIQ
jgi:hypothetical protein